MKQMEMKELQQKMDRVEAENNVMWEHIQDMNQSIPKDIVPEGIILSERKAYVDNSLALMKPTRERSPPASVAALR